ncbi:MAG TPA: ABC transporter ATP-binding protein [Candidatus Acidoferrales bacterium]|nr:ABC transporter ATP-binding protein [Candidatus Acidoferrales bacterium]
MNAVPQPRSAWQPASGAEGVLVRAENLRKTYSGSAGPLPVLNGLNLEVARGEMIAVVGPSGCGKSTLLHLLAALDTPTSGTVYFDGESLAAFSAAKLADFRNRQIGFVWQRHHLLADFTAEENVAFPLLLRGVPMREALAAASEGLERVGLAERRRHRAAELSGGEQQRVAIARALSGQPSLLLADEPTGDLDENTAESVFALLRSLHQERRLTSVLATHNPGLAGRCDRILRLEHGQIQETAFAGNPEPLGGRDQVTHV